MKTLRDYIRLFIKEKYLTNNTKKINILLDSTKCIEVDTIIVNKNNFSLSCEIEIENLLDLPVTKVRFLCDKKLSKIDLEEIEDASSGKIQINISPRLKDIGDNFILYFDCMQLPKIYTDSFLYKLDIFNPSLYHALKKHNNTVISYINYNLAIEYIHEHKDELSELYNIYEDSDHVFLEKIYEKILELKNNKFIIRNLDDSSRPCYIIKAVSEHHLKFMSKNWQKYFYCQKKWQKSIFLAF